MNVENKPRDESKEEPKVFFELCTIYSITFNPQDKYQSFGRADRDVRLRNKLYEWALTLDKHTKFCFHFELSEPKTIMAEKGGPRIHVHGTIEFKTREALKQFLMYKLYQLQHLGVVDIDTIADLAYWEKYCTKQKHIMLMAPLTNEYVKDEYPHTEKIASIIDHLNNT